jgi:hypothetical protein
VQILAPLEGGATGRNVYTPGQRFGHVSRECAAVLAPLMKNGFVSHSCDSDDCNYEFGFTFECHLLSNDTNKVKKVTLLALLSAVIILRLGFIVLLPYFPRKVSFPLFLCKINRNHFSRQP